MSGQVKTTRQLLLREDSCIIPLFVPCGPAEFSSCIQRGATGLFASIGQFYHPLVFAFPSVGEVLTSYQAPTQPVLRELYLTSELLLVIFWYAAALNMVRVPLSAVSLMMHWLPPLVSADLACCHLPLLCRVSLHVCSPLFRMWSVGFPCTSSMLPMSFLPMRSQALQAASRFTAASLVALITCCGS